MRCLAKFAVTLPPPSSEWLSLLPSVAFSWLCPYAASRKELGKGGRKVTACKRLSAKPFQLPKEGFKDIQLGKLVILHSET